MATNVISDLRRILKHSQEIKKEPFKLLSRLSRLVNLADEADSRAVQELLLLALEQREAFEDFAEILFSLVRQVGLFPYLMEREDSLSFRDRLAYELHKPTNLEDVVMHREQAYAYRLLISKKSVVLSAPTSFGKSLIIDAVIASKVYDNIVVLVPTIALIDETRKRLFSKFKEVYKIITHASQSRHLRNVFVLTQERAVEFPDLDKLVDFLVVDEFYKLDPGRAVDGEDNRSILLNQAFERLYSARVPFYFLGPNIEGVAPEFLSRYRAEFIKRADYVTVVTEREHFSKDNRDEDIVKLCRRLAKAEEPTLIYCSGPAQARQVTKLLLNGGLGRPNEELSEAADWVGENYHNEWSYVLALRQGIGLHHGRVPRSLAQFAVRCFDKGLVRFLVCTSTLIEGVNTKAKNIILYDDRLAQRGLDYFTFNNIVGRAGRMFQHFVGRVYVFGSQPLQALPLLDIPLVSQSEKVSTSLLVNLKEESLSSGSFERLRQLKEQKELPYEVIKSNRGVDPEMQIRLANPSCGSCWGQKKVCSRQEE